MGKNIYIYIYRHTHIKYVCLQQVALDSFGRVAHLAILYLHNQIFLFLQEILMDFTIF